MRFLLDENVHRGIFSFLAKLEHDVKLTPKSIKNGEVFELALNEKRTLISRDKDFLNSPIYPSFKHFGIIMLKIPPKDLEMQTRAISKLLKQFPDIRGKVVILFSDEKFEFEK